MSISDKTNICAELKSTYDQLLAEKQEFDKLFGEINALRSNIDKNMSEVQNKILQLKDSRRKLEDLKNKITDEIFTTLYNLENYSEIIQKYGAKIYARIEKKSVNKPELNRVEIIVLYKKYEEHYNLGYEIFMKMINIIHKRDKKNDAPIVLNCQPEEIAWGVNEINENTKAYIGKWNGEIWLEIRKYPNIKHLFESFPDKKIFRQKLVTDPNINSSQSAKEALEGKNIYLSEIAENILAVTKFSKEKKEYELVAFTERQLGLGLFHGARINEIIGNEYDKDNNGKPAPFTSGRMTELGLYLCPAEVGPHLRLQNSNRDGMLIAMKPIVGHFHDLYVFHLKWLDGQSKLITEEAGPGSRNPSGNYWIFSTRKLDA